MIRKGVKVALEYTVSLEDGTQIDSNIGEPPLEFVLGTDQMFPALEAELLGLRIGEEKQIILEPEEAYGTVVEEAFREIDLDSVPQKYRIEGAVIGVQDPEGGVFPIRVHKIEGEKAILDFNHPLAGRSLHFQVKVVGVD
jgi:FKBP-type peptidyl-prolyl cis-trans isomerase 2